MVSIIWAVGANNPDLVLKLWKVKWVSFVLIILTRRKIYRNFNCVISLTLCLFVFENVFRNNGSCHFPDYESPHPKFIIEQQQHSFQHILHQTKFVPNLRSKSRFSHQIFKILAVKLRRKSHEMSACVYEAIAGVRSAAFVLKQIRTKTTTLLHQST